MYDKFIAQAEQFFKPLEEIMALQTQTLEAISQRQSELMSGVWDDSLNYAQNLSGQSSVDEFVKTQQAYLEGMQTRMRSAAEESFDILTASNDKIGSLWQESFSEAGAFTRKATKTAAKKGSSAAKTAANTAKSAVDNAKSVTDDFESAADNAKSVADDAMSAVNSASNKKASKSSASSKTASSKSASSSKASSSKAADSSKQTKSASNASANTAKSSASSKEPSAKASS